MIIKNGKFVTPKGVFKGDLLIEKGKIKKFGYKLKSNDKEFDAKGKYIIPGLIEVHGHLREPGMTDKETILTGTQAAAAGGVTTIIDMPNTKPPTTTVARLKQKIEKIYPKRSCIDYAFFMGVSKKSLKELEKVDSKMIAGVKLFTAGHETVPTTIPDDKTLGKIFKILAERKIIVAVHAEDQWLINYYKKKIEMLGKSNAAVWSELRPMSVVVAAAARAIALAEQYGTKLYLLHLSTPEEFILVEAAKKRGVDVFAELVSYQLIFNTGDYKKLGNKIKVSPAIRSLKDQNNMWQLMEKGQVIDVLCSEHTPHEWKTKNQPDVWKAQSGMPGIQETLPALISQWVKRFSKKNLEAGLIRIAQLSSENPAKIFGFKTKGSIEINKDADLVILETKKTWTVKKKDLFSKCGWSAYEGMKLIGRPIATFVRGSLIYNDGQIISKPLGKWLK